MTRTASIVVCDGDQTGQELLVESLRVMPVSYTHLTLPTILRV